MRNISVSTEVFAAIWALRKPGEETEDVILGRILLGLQRFSFEPDSAVEARPSSGEMRIEEYDLRLPAGFQIFRTYKGKFYTATVENGSWHLQNDNRSYPSLRKLSWAVVRGGENAWKNWNYKDQKGRISKITRLRRDELVRKRTKASAAAVDVSSLAL